MEGPDAFAAGYQAGLDWAKSVDEATLHSFLTDTSDAATRAAAKADVGETEWHQLGYVRGAEHIGVALIRDELKTRGWVLHLSEREGLHWAEATAPGAPVGIGRSGVGDTEFEAVTRLFSEIRKVAGT